MQLSAGSRKWSCDTFHSSVSIIVFFLVVASAMLLSVVVVTVFVIICYFLYFCYFLFGTALDCFSLSQGAMESGHSTSEVGLWFAYTLPSPNSTL